MSETRHKWNYLGSSSEPRLSTSSSAPPRQRHRRALSSIACRMQRGSRNQLSFPRNGRSDDKLGSGGSGKAFALGSGPSCSTELRCRQEGQNLVQKQGQARRVSYTKCLALEADGDGGCPRRDHRRVTSCSELHPGHGRCKPSHVAPPATSLKDRSCGYDPFSRHGILLRPLPGS